MCIDRHAQVGREQLRVQSLGVLNHLIADGDDSDLFGREPEREISPEMLNEHAAETLHRAKGRAVNHDRTVRGIVGSDVGKVEAHG